ncbi:unnamed protein product, partial [Closterium sp. NIES-54]
MSPASCSASPVHTVRTGRVSRLRPPPVPGTPSMTLRPSTAPQRVPLPSPPASSLPAGPDPASDSLLAASPAVTRFLATAVTDPLFESTVASALVTELVDFAAACRLDYATSLVAEFASVSVCPPSVEGECALGTDVLEDRQEEFECFAAFVPHLVSMLLAPEGDPDAPDIPTPRSYAEAIEGPYSSQWQAAMDVEIASWKSTGTYVDEVPPPGANIVSGMWIFRVKRPAGSPPVLKARYVAGGFRQRQGVNFFQTFSPTPKMTTLRVLLHVAAQRDYELHSLDFSTTFLQESLHREIWLRRPPGFTGSLPAGTQAQRTITLTQSHMVQQVLQRFGFTYSSPQSTPLPTGHSLSASPSDKSVEPSGSYPELVGCLMYLMTCTRPDLAYPLSLLARYVAPSRHRKVHWDAAKRVLRYFCSTSGIGLVLGGRARVVLTGYADASWVDDLATQRSSQGYTFSLGATLAHLPADQLGRGASFSSSSEFKLYNGKGGLYIGEAVLKNVFVLDFVPDLGTADSDGIVTFTSWTHPPDLDPDFSLEGFWYSHSIPKTERTRALATIQHSAAAKTTSTAAETTSAAAETTSATAETTSAAAETTSATAETSAAAAAISTPIAGPSTASAQIDDTPPTPAQQLNPTSQEVHRSANFTASFYSNSDLYR